MLLKPPQPFCLSTSAVRKQIMPGMRRKQTIAHLLLTCLLLASSSQFLDFIAIEAEAIETVEVKLGSKQPKSQLSMGDVLAFPEKAQGRKQKKEPSGPNPIGNNHPPIRDRP